MSESWKEYLATVPAEVLAEELKSQGFKVEDVRPPGRKARCDCGSCPLCKHRARQAEYRKKLKGAAK